MLQQFVTVAGARGGHGTSTTAAVLALFLAGHAPTNLVAADPDSGAALLGVPSGGGRLAPLDVTPTLRLTPEVDHGAERVVIDAGTLADCSRSERSDGLLLVVLRGPCYLALRSLLTYTGRPADGVILVHEHGRSLGCHDVRKCSVCEWLRRSSNRTPWRA